MQGEKITTNNTTVVLLVASFNGFLNASLLYAANIAVPAISSEFAMNATLLGWITNSVMVVSAALLLPFGRLADIFGRKRIFEYGLFVVMFSSLLCALSNSTILFFVSRILQGIGTGMTTGTGIAIVGSTFSDQERGKALGITTAGIYLGIACGPFIGGVLTDQLGWRSIFFMLTIFYFLILILALLKLKGDWAEARGEKFDATGSVILILCIILLIYGLTTVTSFRGIILILISIVGAFLFVLWERRTRYPTLNISILKNNRLFLFSNLAVLLNYIGFGALNFLISLYLQYIQGFSSSTAGSIFLINAVFMITFTILAGRLSDKFQPQKIAAIGLLISCIAFILFSFLNMTTALWFVIICLVISGIGQGLFYSPNIKVIVSSVDKSIIGAATGLQSMTLSVGMSISTCIIILLFSIFIGNTQIIPEYYPAFMLSTKIGFLISAVLYFIGIFIQAGGKSIFRQYFQKRH